jgi:predicted porin
MKKIFTLILLVISAVVAFAQSNFYIYKTDGSVVEFVINEVDTIGFIAP